jgi:cell division protease FtsH
VNGDDTGKAWFEPNNLSPEMQAKVDGEINKIMDEAYKSAQKILKDNKKKLDEIAKALIEKETIEEDEFKKLMC